MSGKICFGGEYKEGEKEIYPFIICELIHKDIIMNEFKQNTLHNSWIKDCCFFGTDNIITCSVDKKISVFDHFTRKTPKYLEGHFKPVSAIKPLFFNKKYNSYHIISCSEDATLKIWNVQSLKLRTTIYVDFPVTSVVELENGNIVSGDVSGNLKIWKIDQKMLIKSFYMGSKILSICPLTDGKMIVVCNKGRFVYFFLVSKNFKEKSLLTTEVQTMTYSQCEVIELYYQKKKMFCFGTKEINVWDYENKKKMYSLKGHKNLINCIKELPSGVLVSGSSDCTIRFWCLKKRACVHVHTVTFQVFCIDFQLPPVWSKKKHPYFPIKYRNMIRFLIWLNGNEDENNLFYLIPKDILFYELIQFCPTIYFI